MLAIEVLTKARDWRLLMTSRRNLGDAERGRFRGEIRPRTKPLVRPTTARQQ